MKHPAGLCHLLGSASACLRRSAAVPRAGLPDAADAVGHLVPAGGANDSSRASSANIMTERLGQQVIVENKPGAGGNLGMGPCSPRRPTATPSLSSAPNYAINATLYAKLPFDFVRDSAPVAGTMRLTNVMVVHPSVPAKTVAEFIAHAKANPGKVNFASGGVGTPSHGG